MRAEDMTQMDIVKQIEARKKCPPCNCIFLKENMWISNKIMIEKYSLGSNYQ